MLLLLGDQLIRDAGLAVFELVKNAYDADASTCDIILENIDNPKKSTITVQDNGSGMDYNTVVGVWLEPGTDYRGEQRLKQNRSPKYKRLPLGEKGVGRFAVHKLGRKIQLITRKTGQDEVVVTIDWLAFEKAKYLADVGVDITVRSPKMFVGRKHGTRIEVTELRDGWERRRVRELHRSVTSICSPFEGPDNFSAKLHLKPATDWLSKLLDPESVLKQSLYSAHGSINENSISGTYKFTPLKAMKGKLEKRSKKLPKLQLMSPGKRATKLTLKDSAVGPIEFDFNIFDLEPAVLELTSTDKAGLREYLNVNGGVRVYRDGVRIFDLGEPGNDWLDLEGRRVNRPTVRIGNNQIIGAVHLCGESSRGLIEKTNREGFIENSSYRKFREAVEFALNQVEAERAKDKKRVRLLYSRKSLQEPVIDDLTKLRQQIESRGLTSELGKYLDRIEKQFSDVRATLLTAAGPGLTLTVVIHEVEKIIKELSLTVKRGARNDKVKKLVQHLSEVVDGLSFLVRKSGKSRERASVLIDQALFNTEYRLRAHKIEVTRGIDLGQQDFSVTCMRRLVISTLMNLIDNSIYWLENRDLADKKIYIGTTFELDRRPSLVVADNGSGFQDLAEYLVEPFFTRKPDGMGLGLHIVNEIAKLHHGSLHFPESSDIDLPKEFQDGAIVAFQFPKAL